MVSLINKILSFFCGRKANDCTCIKYKAGKNISIDDENTISTPSTVDTPVDDAKLKEMLNKIFD